MIKVLVADDSEVVLSMLKYMLESKGYEVVTAKTGLESLRKVHHDFPDIIILDLLMPEMNGYVVSRLLKNNPKTSKIPIIILTGARERESRFWSYYIGADEYLEKEENLEEKLFNTIKKYEGIKGSEKLMFAFKNKVIETSMMEALDRLDRELYETTLDKNKLEVILEYMADPVFIIDDKKRITRVNKAFEELVMGSAGEIIGMPCQDVVNSNLCKNNCLYDKLCAQQRPIKAQEIVLNTKNGTTKTFLASLSLIYGLTGQQVGAVCVLTDITKMKEFDKLKDDFVSMVTHEIRNPLAIINSISKNLIYEEKSREFSDEAKEFIKLIHKSSENLLILINDLLDIASFEAGRITLNKEPVDLKEIIELYLSKLEVLAREKNINISFNIPDNFPQIMADSFRLEQVFTNIVSNAVKFAPNNTRIIISGELLKDDRIKISIQDEGPGIPEKYHKSVFDKFLQVKEKGYKVKGGSGLGLAVTKDIVELHGGKIWVEEASGKGAKFSFTLPVGSGTDIDIRQNL